MIVAVLSDLVDEQRLLHPGATWVAVHFTHAFCAPCKRLKPTLPAFWEALAPRVVVATLDVAGRFNAAALATIGVTAVPSLQLFDAAKKTLHCTVVFSAMRHLEQAFADLLSLVPPMELHLTISEPLMTLPIRPIAAADGWLLGDSDAASASESDEVVDAVALLSRFFRLDASLALETFENCAVPTKIDFASVCDVRIVSVNAKLHAVLFSSERWHVVRFSVRSRRWKLLQTNADFVPNLRVCGASVCASGDGSFVVVGGLQVPLREAVADCFECAVTKRDAVWRRVSTSRSPPARGHASLVAVPGGDLLLCGGDGGEPDLVEFGDAHRLDSRRDWHIATPTASCKPRMKHSAVLAGELLLLVGGESDFKPLLGADSLAALNVITNCWQELVFGANDVPNLAVAVGASDDGGVLVVDDENRLRRIKTV
jgi:thiol-disulfide isomerase/thioredoxin